MNFSYEEIYYHFGQYDTFVILSFDYESDEFKKFGNEFLMGNFIYTIEEREELEKKIKEEPNLRTDKKVKFSPSKLLKLNEDNLILLDKEGIQVSSITRVSSLNNHKENKFSKKGKKEIENEIVVRAPHFSSEELHKCLFSLLNNSYKKGDSMTPKKEKEYWAFRKHYEIGLDEEDFKVFFEKQNSDFLDEIKLIELEIKFRESKISEDEKKEYKNLLSEKLEWKKKIIDSEMKKSHEKVRDIPKIYGVQLYRLIKECDFDEEIFLFGKTPIYLDFERLVHVFARHVNETLIGDRSKGKTTFQYEYNDVLKVLKQVIEKEKYNIQASLNKGEKYRRMGKRACYMNGNYYNLEINPNGKIMNFYPLNNNM